MNHSQFEAQCPKCSIVVQVISANGKAAHLDCPHFTFSINPLTNDGLPLAEVVQWASYGSTSIGEEDLEAVRRQIDAAVGETLDQIGNFFFGDESQRGRLAAELRDIFPLKWQDQPSLSQE